MTALETALTQGGGSFHGEGESSLEFRERRSVNKKENKGRVRGWGIRDGVGLRTWSEH